MCVLVIKARQLDLQDPAASSSSVSLSIGSKRTVSSALTPRS